MDGMLSQEEINALLSGMGTEETHTETVQSSDNALNEMERDALGEISNISMGTAATTLSSLVNLKVDITTPTVSISNLEELVDKYDRPCVFLQISYKEGLDGNNVLVLKESDVKIIADLMMGGDGNVSSEGELGELQLSAISEAMNQMMGSASTSMSSMLGTKIDISPPVASLIDFNDVMDEKTISEFLKGDFVRIGFRMTIGNLVDSEIMQLFPIEFSKTLCNKFGVGVEKDEDTKPLDDVKSAASQNTMQMNPASQQQVGSQAYSGMDNMGMPMNNMGMGMQNMGMPMQNMGMPMNNMGMGMPMQNMGMPMNNMGMGMPNMGMPMQNVNVQQAQFQAFSQDNLLVTQKENINLIMDVPLEVTVELGRTTKSIQDILEFAPGTIIELDKIAGEPIDVLVNGKYVAKGEVVVIEESFGVRVTEIIK